MNFLQKSKKLIKKYGIMNARHKRKGKALPKRGRSLTAAIAARCAAKTWYNERSPRRAGVTMAICAGRQSCRHKKTRMDRELALSPDVRDPAGRNRGCRRISERAEASRKGMEDSPACEESGGRAPKSRDGKEDQPGDSR